MRDQRRLCLRIHWKEFVELFAVRRNSGHPPYRSVHRILPGTRVLGPVLPSIWMCCTRFLPPSLRSRPSQSILCIMFSMFVTPMLLFVVSHDPVWQRGREMEKEIGERREDVSQKRDIWRPAIFVYQAGKKADGRTLKIHQKGIKILKSRPPLFSSHFIPLSSSCPDTH